MRWIDEHGWALAQVACALSLAVAFVLWVVSQ